MSRKSNNPPIQHSNNSRHPGFTLIEIVLVIVIITIISGIALPFFAQSFRGNKLRIAARTVAKSAMYARNMAILRGKTHTLKLTEDSVEVLAEIPLRKTPQTDENIEETDEEIEDLDPNRQFRRYLPDGIMIAEFEMEIEEETDEEGVYYINYYPNGMSDEFRLVFEDQQGMTIEMFSDPISGKVTIEFLQ